MDILLHDFAPHAGAFKPGNPHCQFVEGTRYATENYEAKNKPEGRAKALIRKRKTDSR
jgi:hypothetical protein